MNRNDARPSPVSDEMLAELRFVVPAAGKPSVHFIRPSEVDIERTEGTFSRVQVAIRNGRNLGRETSLDEEGFIFTHWASEVSDFYDDAQIRTTYYAEMAALVESLTGASQVIVFDHTVRGTIAGKRGSVVVELPSDMMHCDLTEAAALETIEQVFPLEEIAAIRRRRIMQINLWRPIAGPVRDMPLAVCDGRSIRAESCVTTSLVRPDFTSEFITLAHDPSQRWYWLPAMAVDEVIIFKNYDSEVGKSRFAMHGAFADPASSSESPPRESIEVRAFAVI